MFSRILLAVWLGWACFSGFGSPSPGHYAIDVWTTEDGLPQNSVMAVTQTRDGYLWVGTLNGLARFDGTSFVLFDESNTPGLNSSRIFRLFEDSQTNLWIGTESGGIALAERSGRITTASVSPGRESSATRLLSITEDHTGTVWVYTADGQLGRYFDRRMDIWNASFGLASQVRSLAADDSGLLWVGADSVMVAVGPLPARATGLPIADRLTPGKLDFLLTSRRGGYWRLANGRIAKCTGAREDRDLGLYPWKRGVIVTAACEDLQGNLIVGTYGDPGGDGVYWFDSAGKPYHIEGLSHSSILSLAMDREGSLWVGTDGGGLNRVRPQVFNVLEGTKGATVQSLCSDRSGGLWIGYNGDRVDHWSAGRIQQYTVSKPPVSLAVRSVFVDNASNVWCGTYGAGLFRLREGVFEQVNEFSDVANLRVSSIFQDKRGRLWVGTQGGLAYSDGNDWKTLGGLDGLSASPVQAIAEDSEGNLWVGTAGGGLNRLSLGKVTVFTRTNGLPSNDVSALWAGKSGVLWVGTSAGLARFGDGRWTTFNTRHGLAGNSIRYLIEDGHGFLWIGSNAGLMRAATQGLHDFTVDRASAVSVRAYGKADGVPTRECSQGSQPGAAQTADGRLWFTTIKGVAVVDSRSLTPNTNPPQVVIESILIDGQPQSPSGLRSPVPQSLTVPAGRETIDIRFANLSLSAPEKVRFRYRLEGHETSWTEGSGNHGVAHYTRVPAREYLFRVQAANEDDTWNLAGAGATITVLPPFWQTWWFIGLSSLVALGIVVGVVHYVSTQKLQRQLAAMRQQEALERERARIARDLHDQLGANLTQVALLGDLAEADKALPKEVESHARQISATARETTRSLDEIVWTVNPENDTLDGLVNYVCKYVQDYLGTANLKYRIEVPPDLPAIPISPEVRHNVFLATREAVNNVVKHSKASSAWLGLELENDHFTLEIQDDGVGLEAGAEKKGRNGLRNMRSRMQDIGGEFGVAPREHGGTTVRLTAPLKPVAPRSSE